MSKKQTSSDYRQLIREAVKLIHQEVDEYRKIIEKAVVECDDDILSFYTLDDVYDKIMAKERKRDSIKWEAALITVMESSLMVYSGYIFQYVEPNIPDCEFRYKHFKKLISKNRNPKIKIFSGGILERINGFWCCYSIWQ